MAAVLLRIYLCRLTSFCGNEYSSALLASSKPWSAAVPLLSDVAVQQSSSPAEDYVHETLGLADLWLFWHWFWVCLPNADASWPVRTFRAGRGLLSRLSITWQSHEALHGDATSHSAAMDGLRYLRLG